MPPGRCDRVSLAAAAANSESITDAGRDEPGVLVWVAADLPGNVSTRSNDRHRDLFRFVLSGDLLN
jgi:hypothetical protein